MDKMKYERITRATQGIFWSWLSRFSYHRKFVIILDNITDFFTKYSMLLKILFKSISNRYLKNIYLIPLLICKYKYIYIQKIF
jgi:hypothetical protein